MLTIWKSRPIRYDQRCMPSCCYASLLLIMHAAGLTHSRSALSGVLMLDCRVVPRATVCCCSSCSCVPVHGDFDGAVKPENRWLFVSRRALVSAATRACLWLVDSSSGMCGTVSDCSHATITRSRVSPLPHHVLVLLL